MDASYVNNSSSALSGEMPWAGLDVCPTSVSGTTFLIIAYSAVIAVGLIGNTCLVFVISRQKEMRNVTNIFIANLSCSDILMGIVCLPVTIIYTLMDRWILGEALCKVTPFVQCMSVTVSIFSLVLIALERHQLILHPTGWKPMVGHSYLAVAVIWVVACFISLPFLSFQYCLPVILIVLCYLRIFLRLRRRRDMVDRAREARKRAKGSQRVNTMLVSIVVVFTLCWLPLYVFNTVFDWNHEAISTCQHDVIFSSCHLTAMASTCVNPIIYGFLNSNFQKELKATLQRCRCWGAPESYESFPLSVVSTEVTKVSSLSNGSFSVNT
ncbi:hypothetical protein ANANG_G00190160 [Anguilla anguilla]|uniref:G-protein coupled receptors family 1 profile domain-containing protein n=1 Tax=Anguilla anguilla TaxID=7936 RepID=A0A9D3RRH2_ANGAN|nr:hypothetical protein ANANG_G00190160 [Anguilla anguilla]